MKRLSVLFAGISLAALVDVVWLHAAAYGVSVEAFDGFRRVVWGLAVPWFFLSSMFWMAVKWRGFKVEMGRRVRSLLVPYFIWCLFGSGWSILLNGLQLKGWEMLRYVGLHPWMDPAYQPMWFIRNLFLVLLAEACLLRLVERWRRIPACHRQFSPPAVLAYVFPVYVLHSLWLSILRKATGQPRFEGAWALVAVVTAIGLSVVATWCLRKWAPRLARVVLR